MEALDIDMPWPSSDTPNHAPLPVGESHEAFIATLSNQWIGLQCSCGVNWTRPRHKIRLLKP